jgi:hypothetical protein
MRPLFSSGSRRRNAVRGFDPLSLAPALWLRADAGTFQTSGGSAAVSDTDPVGEWQDQSGNGNHAGNTLTARPLLKLNIINGLPVLRFDGVDDVLNTSTFTLNQPLTIAFVAKGTFDTNTYWFDGITTLNTRVISRPAENTLRLFSGGIFDRTSSDTTNPFAAICVFNGASSVINFNGSESSGDVGATNGAGLRIGSEGGGGASLHTTGDYGEIVVVARALGAGERTSLYDYLKGRWGTP